MWASWHAGRGPVKHLAAANPSHRARARGVILSVDNYTLVFGGTFPVGAFLVGAISERWGVGAAMLAAGGLRPRHPAGHRPVVDGAAEEAGCPAGSAVRVARMAKPIPLPERRPVWYGARGVTTLPPARSAR